MTQNARRVGAYVPTTTGKREQASSASGTTRVRRKGTPWGPPGIGCTLRVRCRRPTPMRSSRRTVASRLRVLRFWLLTYWAFGDWTCWPRVAGNSSATGEVRFADGQQVTAHPND